MASSNALVNRFNSKESTNTAKNAHRVDIDVNINEKELEKKIDSAMKCIVKKLNGK